jgi:cytochrome o ubiquinol oxidase operon protein cyoD
MTEVHTTIAGEHQGSLLGYSVGFILSALLTAIPFGLVMTGILPRAGTLVGIFAAAVVQILVHLRFFLHMDGSSEERWNLMTFLFTALVMAIFIGGTLWIMLDLSYRMMG